MPKKDLVMVDDVTSEVHSALHCRLEFFVFAQAIFEFGISAALMLAWLKKSLVSSLLEQDFLRDARADSCFARFFIGRLFIRISVDSIEIDRKLRTVETNIFLCTALSLVTHHLYLVGSDQIGAA